MKTYKFELDHSYLQTEYITLKLNISIEKQFN